MINLSRINKFKYKCFKPIHELSEEVLAGSSRSKEELNNDISIGLGNVLRFKQVLKDLKKELKKYGPPRGFLTFNIGTVSENIKLLKMHIQDCKVYESILNSLSLLIEHPDNEEIRRCHKEFIAIADKYIDIQPNWKVYLTLGSLFSRKKKKEPENVPCA